MRGKNHIVTVHPDLRAKFCVSPVCRWRVELAWNSFATCQALGNGHEAESKVNWRGEIFSLHTTKRIINVMHDAKDSCHQVRKRIMRT
jgi:hypothetical protein